MSYVTVHLAAGRGPATLASGRVLTQPWDTGVLDLNNAGDVALLNAEVVQTGVITPVGSEPELGEWLPLANLGIGVTPLGDPFLSTCDCRMEGDDLKFRGNLACSSNGSGFRMFDLPVGIAPPPVIRRLYPQTSGTSNVSLNFNPDGHVTLAGSSGTFVILDGCSIPGWI